MQERIGQKDKIGRKKTQTRESFPLFDHIFKIEKKTKNTRNTK